MVQGLIEEKKLDEFNIPQYTPSPREVKELVENEGSFSIDRLEVTRVNWNVYENDGDYNMIVDWCFEYKLIDAPYGKIELPLCNLSR